MNEKCVQHHVRAADIYSSQKERGEEKKHEYSYFCSFDMIN